MYKTKWTQEEFKKAKTLADKCIEESIAHIKKKHKETLKKTDFGIVKSSANYMKLCIRCKKAKYTDYAEDVAIREDGKVERYPAN